MTARRCCAGWRRSRSKPTADQARPFRMPVQWVNRPNLDFRGFAGSISQPAWCGPGDAVRILPSGRTTTIARIVTADGDKTRPSPARR